MFSIWLDYVWTDGELKRGNKTLPLDYGVGGEASQDFEGKFVHVEYDTNTKSFELKASSQYMCLPYICQTEELLF